MVKEVPYNYFNILALMAILKYERRRSIDMMTLHRFHVSLREDIMFDIKKQAKTGNASEIVLVPNMRENLDDFLREYSSICYLKDRTIYLRDNVTYDDLAKLEDDIFTKEKLEQYFARMTYYSFSPETRRILGISSIERIMTNYTKEVEEKIYDAYLRQDYDGIEFKKLLLKRLLFEENVKMLPKEMLDGFTEVDLVDPLYGPHFIKKEEWNDYFDILSDTDEEESSLDDDLEEDEEMDDDMIEPPYFTTVFYDTFIYAIFGEGNLGSVKTDDMLFRCNIQRIIEAITSDIGENVKEADFTFMTTEEKKEFNLSFYLQYIKRLDDLIKGNTNKKWKERLILARKRLLYALDDTLLCLYNKDNLDREYEKSLQHTFEDDDFGFISYLVTYLIGIVFTSEENDLTMLYLTLIGTYYDLSLDKTVIKEIQNYADYPQYEEYAKIILNGDHRERVKKRKK